MRRYQIQIGDSVYDLTVEPDGAEFRVTVDGNERAVTVADINDNRALFLVDSLAREVDLRKRNGNWSVFIEGRQIDVSVLDYRLAELQKTAGVRHAAHMPRELRAPMPGKALKIEVAPGDSVSRGDTLLVLEAMKMENLIKAAGDGVVKRVIIKAGDSVERGEQLIEFE